jgi:chemotaxis protein CheD
VERPPADDEPAPPGATDDASDAAGTRDVTRARVFVQGGEVFAAAEPTEVVTVLGSCVAVCLFDPGTRTGGVNHFLLSSGPEPGSARFGPGAMQLLLERRRALGARHHALRAKVFGGAAVLGTDPRTGHGIGEQNVELAYRLLAGEGIAVRNADVGGTHGRKLVFHTDTGDAWVATL